MTLAFESRTDAYYKLSQNIGLSRGKEDKDTAFLIFEEVVTEEGKVGPDDSGFTEIGPGLEVDFSAYYGENGEE
jgi:hypothetical protein